MKMLKALKNKLSTIAEKTAYASLNNACTKDFYQPTLPDALKATKMKRQCK